MRVNKTYDNLLLLKDAYLMAVSAPCQVLNVAKIINIGAGDCEGDILIDVSAIEVDSDDERYRIGAQFSDSPTFATGIWELMSIELGSGGTCYGDAIDGDTDMGVGRYILPFQNRIGDGSAKSYMRLYVTIQGTVNVGINFSAYAGMRAM